MFNFILEVIWIVIAGNSTIVMLHVSYGQEKLKLNCYENYYCY